MTDFVTGDTGSILRVTCKDNDTGNVIDLTGASVKLRWVLPDNTVEERNMTLEDVLNGIVRYQFQAGELVAPRMRFEVEITDVGGKITSNVKLIDAVVREELG